MLNEQEFKKQLIDKLNIVNSNWRDGDLDSLTGKKVDIINDELRVAIEIKDDTQYKQILPSEPGETVENLTNLSQKNRQFKNHLKSANEKFKNYAGYKSIIILRTEMSNNSGDTIKYTINGPKTIGSPTGLTRPSTFFRDNDTSIKEIGVFLFWGRKVFYRKNNSPNINQERIISKEKLEKVIGYNLENLEV